MQKKLPENAKLVFKGVIHDVYQWEQEIFVRNTINRLIDKSLGKGEV